MATVLLSYCLILNLSENPLSYQLEPVADRASCSSGNTWMPNTYLGKGRQDPNSFELRDSSLSFELLLYFLILAILKGRRMALTLAQEILVFSS